MWETNGSSPLTRGKLTDLIQALSGIRLIPAHAGKTGCRLPRGSGERAHPRSRGENMVSDGKVSLEDGSSPLTRGKRAGRPSGSTARRLIPAHAGKTAEVNVSHFSFPAHPRSRGENLFGVRACFFEGGSSPLTRGKPRWQRSESRSAGLIPAHAGKTLCMSQYVLDGRAHPRSRGENTTRVIAAFSGCGSSPLTRGKRILDTECPGDARLIPAHAGKTERR